jgi:hypothetical protein
VAGSCEHGNEPSDSIKGGEFFDYLSDFQLSRRTSLHRVKFSLLCWLVCCLLGDRFGWLTVLLLNSVYFLRP